MEGRRGKSRRGGLTERDRFWLRHIETAARAGTPATEYARQHGLSLGALYEAKRRLVRRGALEPTAVRERVSFARVQVTPSLPLPSTGPFRVRLVSGAVLEWATAPGVEALAALIERVERAR